MSQPFSKEAEVYVVNRCALSKEFTKEFVKAAHIMEVPEEEIIALLDKLDSYKTTGT